MLPLLELPTDCLLTLEKGKLRNGQRGVLNPFAYSTVNGVLVASARWADSREWKIPLIGKSQEEKDFYAFVLVAETPEGRLEVIRTDESGKKMDKVVVVPGRGQEPIWICNDGWHLSRIERDGDRVTATPVLLSAPFQDLVSWFRDLNGKIRRAKALEWVRSAVTGTGAWAPELWEDPGDGRVYAHSQFREETAWAKGSLDLGIASLHGVAAMAIPPASEYARAVLSKYVTVKAGCFESLETALSCVKADTGDTTHVVAMLMRRAVVVGAHWRARPVGDELHLVGDELHLHVVLNNPVKATQVLIRQVPLADNAMNYLELLPESAITDTHRKEELVVLTRSLDPQERKRAIGRREAFYKPPPKEELVATMTANRDQLVIPEEKRRKYQSLADFFHKRHAPEVDKEVVLFLLVGMVEAASPFDGWFTKGSESIMHALHLNEELFEAAVGAVMAGKAGFFLFEGFEEAFEEGFSVTSLVSGLSYAFTWCELFTRTRPNPSLSTTAAVPCLTCSCAFWHVLPTFASSCELGAPDPRRRPGDTLRNVRQQPAVVHGHRALLRRFEVCRVDARPREARGGHDPGAPHGGGGGKSGGDGHVAGAVRGGASECSRHDGRAWPQDVRL